MKFIDLSGGFPEKKYYTNYLEHGYEFGVGGKGLYSGHSHHFFHDIIFCPSGIEYKTCDDIIKQSKLIIVEPRTYLGDVSIGDFAFIKFCSTNHVFTPPEKTNKILKEGGILEVNKDCSFEINWHKSSAHPRSLIKFSLLSNSLVITVNRNGYKIS